MRRPSLAVLILVAAASPAAAQWRDEVTAPRNATVNAAGASRARIHARAGTLRIEGRDGIAEVRVRGTARASSRSLLDAVELRAERRGDEVLVRVETPDHVSNGYAGLDLVIEVPPALALEVVDGSGGATIRHVGALDVEDGSGELEIEDVGGRLRVRDGSGELIIRNVRGDLAIEDGSGSVRIRDVRGSIVAEDGSGSFDADVVTGSIRVRSKGAGSVDVSRVGGDFIVDRKGSGSVTHHDVRGRVDVPERRRGRSRSEW